MFLYVLTEAQREDALQFNNANNHPEWPDGFVYEPSGGKLPSGIAVNPITIYTGPYAGNFVLPTTLISNTDFAVMWNFLGTLPTQDVNVDDLSPPEE